MKLLWSALISASLAVAAVNHDDWPDIAKYADANARLAAPASGEQRVVFMGDSITEGWNIGGNIGWNIGGNIAEGGFFPGKPYINRGISGQTTPQMLIRFRPDVVALKPKVVVILAATNDLAGNTGPTTLAAIEDNFMSMCDIARQNGIRVVLSSVLPVYDYPWKPGIKPADKIAALNSWLKDYAAKNGFIYLDYFPSTAGENRGMKPELSGDGVHPNKAGYAVMAPLAEKAIAEALAQ